MRAGSVAGPGSSGPGRWDNLLRATRASALEVTRRDGVVVRGTFRSADTQTLVLDLPSGSTLTFAEADVARVVMITRGRDSLRNGAVIGAAIGVGYVLGVLAYLAGGEGGEPSSANWITGPLIGAGLGAGVGALVDLARGGQKRLLIYAAARAQE